MDFTDLIERLGTAVAVAVVLGYWVRWLISEIRNERDYARARDASYVEAMREITAAIQKIEQALVLLSERVK